MQFFGFKYPYKISTVVDTSYRTETDLLKYLYKISTVVDRLQLFVCCRLNICIKFLLLQLDLYCNVVFWYFYYDVQFVLCLAQCSVLVFIFFKIKTMQCFYFYYILNPNYVVFLYYYILYSKLCSVLVLLYSKFKNIYIVFFNIYFF